MSNRKKNVICAGTIVFRLNEVGEIDFLLIKNAKNPNRWGLPKGHLEENRQESIEECAVRETWEETGGLVARLLYELPPIFTSNKKESKTVYIFLAKQLNPQHAIQADGKEIVEAKWFPMDNLPEIHSYQKTAINSAIRIISKAIEE